MLYRINTYEYLLDGVKSMLTDSGEAVLVHPSIWAESSMGVLSNSYFYIDLIDRHENNDQIILLKPNISISAFRPNADGLFWYALARLDRLNKTES